MSKTVESYRNALEGEISRWNGFAIALRRGDREAFDELMHSCRSYAPEGSCAEKTTVLETMEISIMLVHGERIKEIEETLDAIKPPSPPEEEKKTVEPVVAEQKPMNKPQRSLFDFE